MMHTPYSIQYSTVLNKGALHEYSSLGPTLTHGTVVWKSGGQQSDRGRAKVQCLVRQTPPECSLRGT